MMKCWNITSWYVAQQRSLTLVFKAHHSSASFQIWGLFWPRFPHQWEIQWEANNQQSPFQPWYFRMLPLDMSSFLKPNWFTYCTSCPLPICKLKNIHFCLYWPSINNAAMSSLLFEILCSLQWSIEFLLPLFFLICPSWKYFPFIISWAFTVEPRSW